MTLKKNDLKDVGHETLNQIVNQAWHQIRLQVANKAKGQVINQCWNEVNYKVAAQVNSRVHFKFDLELNKTCFSKKKI
jgi:hypothetical protein